MTLKMFGFIASVSAVALTLSAGEVFAGGAKGVVSAAPVARPGMPVGPRPFMHHLGARGFGFPGGVWPGVGFYDGGAPYGEPLAGTSLPLTNDINYTYTYKQDVPWDWAHRLPPNVTPSDRPYVSTCSNDPVTVPGRNGDQTVNVFRCY
ncbi:MAG: hypothetical protein GY844_02910 [Bradyrhizobium sp.]|nr:hypothetical protein [Bradyrhizobium sp.]